MRAGFAAVADLDAPAQQAHLASLDADVSTEIKRLLERDRAMGESNGVAPGGAVRAMLERAYETPSEAPAPVQIGAYRVLSRISAGGMGAVFKCTGAAEDKPVAVKVLSPTLCSRDAIRRFEHEAEALERLHDPNVVHILSHGIADLGLGDQPYIAMELVEGVPLDQHARDGALTRTERVALIAEVARAAHRIHLRGIVHRDLKPANVLVTRGGVPTIVDFGIARVGWGNEGGLTSLTLAGQLPGTLEYMSPEQAAGDEADPRGDVYALGAMLYELLTGRVPVLVGDAGIGRALAAIARDEPQRPRTIDPTIGRDAELVVIRALAKAPADRYQSAAELAAELERVVRGDAVLARAPGLLVRARRMARQHPVGARATVLVLCVATVLGATAGALGVRAAAAERRAQTWEGATGEAFAVLEHMLVELSRNHLGPDATAVDLLGTIADQINDLAPTPEARASALSNIAYAYFLIEEYPAAMKWYEQSIPAAAALHGERSPEVILEQYRASLAQAASGNSEAALAMADGMLALADEPKTPDDAILISDLHLARGVALNEMHRFAEANDAFEVARVLALEAGGPDHTRHIKGMLNVAKTHIAMGEYAPALEMLDETIVRNVRIRDEAHARTWRARVARAEALHGLGRFGESEEAYRRALAVMMPSHGPGHPATAYACAGLARTLLDAGHACEAHDLLADVVSREPKTWWLGIRDAAEYADDLRRAEEAMAAEAG
ncbi:MAG: hypothetical protein DHS20C14_17870 [Phycisphaeraceae bacterium]|nr:MAG: hypothetical protein DHS20C14_17870 [Phycisphaeraceae bacterium]